MNTVITQTEFLKVWFRCKTAMDLLVMEKSYEELTLHNISQRTGLPESAIATYFQSLDTLLEMYDGTIVLEQALKIKFGQEKPE